MAVPWPQAFRQLFPLAKRVCHAARHFAAGQPIKCKASKGRAGKDPTDLKSYWFLLCKYVYIYVYGDSDHHHHRIWLSLSLSLYVCAYIYIYIYICIHIYIYAIYWTNDVINQSVGPFVCWPYYLFVYQCVSLAGATILLYPFKNDWVLSKSAWGLLWLTVVRFWGVGPKKISKKLQQ